MRLAASFTSFVMMAASAAHADGASTGRDAGLVGPLVPAAEGKLICNAPDPARKTCRGLSRFSVNDAGQIINTVETALDPGGKVIARGPASLNRLRDGRLCGTPRAKDVARLTFTVMGQPATDRQTWGIREAMLKAMANNFDREVCTTFRRDGEGVVAEVTIGGEPRPDLTTRAIWVAPADGYEVRAYRTGS